MSPWGEWRQKHLGTPSVSPAWTPPFLNCPQGDVPAPQRHPMGHQPYPFLCGGPVLWGTGMGSQGEGCLLLFQLPGAPGCRGKRGRGAISRSQSEQPQNTAPCSSKPFLLPTQLGSRGGWRKRWAEGSTFGYLQSHPPPLHHPMSLLDRGGSGGPTDPWPCSSPPGLAQSTLESPGGRGQRWYGHRHPVPVPQPPRTPLSPPH